MCNHHHHQPINVTTAGVSVLSECMSSTSVVSQDLPNLKREAKEIGERACAVMRRTRPVAWRHVHDRAFWTQLRLELPLPPPPCPHPHPHTQPDHAAYAVLTTFLYVCFDTR
jgi:hypothetical protein